MPTPEQNPTDPRPDMASTPSTPDDSAERDATVNPTPDTAPSTPDAAPAGQPGALPSSTQQNMGDGAGIRGDYGDASQTNGLEGGPDPATPDQPLTDTELTGS